MKKTLDQCKDEIARGRGSYKNWDDYYNWIARDGELPSVVAQLIEGATEEACELFHSDSKDKMQSEKFQYYVNDWMEICFGKNISKDKIERCHRFLEESLELVQSIGCSKADAIKLVDYVFSRPAGEPSKETGGVMVTLAALCNACMIDIGEQAEVELNRICQPEMVEKIIAKRASKTEGSPLPGGSGVNKFDLSTPFAVELLWNNEISPDETARLGYMSADYDKYVKEYNEKEAAVWFSNTQVDYDSCDCTEGGCNHPDWPFAIRFTNNDKICNGDFEEENSLILTGTKNCIRIDDYTKITMGQFMDLCDLAGINLIFSNSVIYRTATSSVTTKEYKNDGMDALKIYRFQVDHIDDTLRIVANIFDSRKKATCIDRQIVKSIDWVKEILVQAPATPLPYGAADWNKISDGEPEDNWQCHWCRLPIIEPPYVGSMCDTDFDIKHYTHWKKIENDFFPVQ